MHKPEVHALARAEMAEVTPVILPGTTRFDVVAPLAAKGCVGIELGVAAGSFSARMVHSGRFAHFWGVDIYGDGHNVKEYRKALLTVGLTANYRLLRMTFDEALELFPDSYFDFIYCDGYAHTGEEGGRTMADWYAKLKPGGVMAGDDYDTEAWPLVVWAVHDLVAQLGVPLFVTDVVTEDAYNRYRSWYFIKPETVVALRPSPVLREISDAEKARVAHRRDQKRRSRRAAAKAAAPEG